jgi:molybdate transport system substrate-binding protein
MSVGVYGSMRRCVGIVILLAGMLVTGCGGSGSSGPLVVYGASPLSAAVAEYGESLASAEVKTAFGRPDQLAERIRRGADADVFLSTDTEYAAQLYKDGLVKEPRVFASDNLVVIAPADSDLSSFEELARPGAKILVEDPDLPTGANTRAMLERMLPGERARILANISIDKAGVGSIIAKIKNGDADAAVVYLSDFKAVENELTVIAIPPGLLPEIAYAGAVVKGSDNPAGAGEFLAGLIDGEGARDLRRAGFLPPLEEAQHRGAY